MLIVDHRYSQGYVAWNLRKFELILLVGVDLATGCAAILNAVKNNNKLTELDLSGTVLHLQPALEQISSWSFSCQITWLCFFGNMSQTTLIDPFMNTEFTSTSSHHTTTSINSMPTKHRVALLLYGFYILYLQDLMRSWDELNHCWTKSFSHCWISTEVH